jgi:hypothetical protein
MRAVDPLRLQAAYYLVSGIWPIVHLRSFMALTGPKRDTWLVQTFGALVAALGSALLASTRSPERVAATRVGVASALALAAADTVFVARRRIRPVYLLDALAELWLVAGLVRRGPAARR